MKQNFCKHYKGDCFPPTNRYCRVCPDAEPFCNRLWEKVLELSNSNGGKPVALPKTRAVMLPNNNEKDNHNIVHLKINVTWNLTKEDYLHYISTGHARMGRKEQRKDPFVSPSLTRQEPYVHSITELLGGISNPLVLDVQKKQLEK
ncbi:hypothetical protein J2128_001155 [Methanomicrobium sp. W14]|uniref:hypothetical protein n=1 Tax=Methanomicrobium sp. W14 TaxID=2817839 RepID=UPI001AE9E763|nr:hypothetical protein [Methanomicrobium sp. W14]MBP2133234.1 hypothetical protein [Methanomicrobium sp. W14]